MGRIHVCCIVAMVGGVAPAVAQQQSERSGVARAPYVAEAIPAQPEPPRVDGVLDDEAWAYAPVFSDFIQRDPDEGVAGTENTEFRVVYTNDALYVAVRAYDSQAAEITALLTRRDEWSPSDEVSIFVDSYHDKRTAFSFTLNAAGVKRDAYFFNDNNDDDRWDAVWDGKTSIDAEGWAAEFRIPFDQLRFSGAEENVFGFNIQRKIPRLNEEQHWRLVPKDASGIVSLFGELTGIRQITPGRRLEILPYSVVTQDQHTAEVDNPFRTGSALTTSFGADVKYGVSSALTLTATVNPDFGQVEADPAVVNLSAFETFFPERRPFFNEGLDIFRFGIGDGDGDGSQESLFYTRRIGRSPQLSADPRGGYAESVDHTTIVAAAKLSGKTQNGWTMGVTGALTDEEGADVVAGDGSSHRDVVEPRAGYLVGRLARDFRDGQTQLGLFGTTVQRALPNNITSLHTRAYTGGLDWSHRFADNTYAFNGRIVGSRVQGDPEAITRTQRSSARYYQRPDNDYVTLDSTRTSLSGFAAAMNFGKTAGDWRWHVGVDTRSPGLEVNDLGFQRNADVTQQWIWVNKRWLTPGKVFRRFNVNFNQWMGWDYGGERRFAGGNLNANYQLWNYWNGYFGFNRQLSGNSPTQLRGGPSIRTPGGNNGWLGLRTDGRKSLRGGSSGWFFIQDENDSWGAGLDFDLSWRPRSNIDVTLSPEINWNRDEWQYLSTETVAGNPEYLFGSLRQTTTSLTLRSNLTFSPTLSLQVYAEPFVSAGQYVGFKRVSEPKAAGPFLNQFEDLGPGRSARDTDGNVDLDITNDGMTDVTLGNPDFTFLSLRSNVVLRWEYLLGSTAFLVWQHGRSDFNDDGRFQFGSNIDDLFSAQAQNVFLLKINYWISP